MVAAGVVVLQQRFIPYSSPRSHSSPSILVVTLISILALLPNAYYQNSQEDDSHYHASNYPAYVALLRLRNGSIRDRLPVEGDLRLIVVHYDKVVTNEDIPQNPLSPAYFLSLQLTIYTQHWNPQRLVRNCEDMAS